MAKSKVSFLATLGGTVVFLALLMAGAVQFHNMTEQVIRNQQTAQTGAELQKMQTELKAAQDEKQKVVISVREIFLTQLNAEKEALDQELKAPAPKGAKATQAWLTARKESATRRLEYLTKELPTWDTAFAAPLPGAATETPVKRELGGSLSPRAAWMEQIEMGLATALLPALVVLFTIGFVVRLLSLVAPRPLRFFREGAGSSVLNGISGLLLAGGIGAVLAAILFDLPVLSQLTTVNSVQASGALKAFLSKFTVAIQNGVAGVCGYGILSFFNSLAATPVAAKIEAAPEKAPRAKKGPTKEEDSLRHQQVKVVEPPKKAVSHMAPPPPSSKKTKAAPPPPAAVVAAVVAAVPTPAPVVAAVEEFPAFETPSPAAAIAEDFPSFDESSIELPELPTNTAEVNLKEEFPVHDFTAAREEASVVEEFPVVAPAEEDRLANLRHRLETLNEYIQKADEDKASGVMPLEMWEEERAVYLEEKQRLETELTELEHSRAA